MQGTNPITPGEWACGADVSDCYSAGTAVGSKSVGGLVGENACVEYSECCDGSGCVACTIPNSPGSTSSETSTVTITWTLLISAALQHDGLELMAVSGAAGAVI